MAFGRDKIKNDLKKAIYKAIAKAYKQNIPFVKEAVDGVNKEHAVNHIIADLEDDNNVAQVPENHIPVDKDNVLHKDIPDVKEMHDAKEAQAKAKLGIMPLAGQKGAINMSEAPSKGVQKLKKFMGDRQMAKTAWHEKGVHHPTPRDNKDSGESLTGHYARKGDSLAHISDYESGKEVANSLHNEKLAEIKKMPKPNLPKSEEMSKGDSNKVPLKDFHNMLSQHDWYHSYDDNIKTRNAGEEKESHLKQIAEQSPEHKQLFENYHRHMFSGPSFGTQKHPKPENLDKAREDELIHPSQRQKFREEKRKMEGRDILQDQVTSSRGVSDVGIEVRRADKRKPGVISHGYARIAEPEFHATRAKKYLQGMHQRIKDMPKPNLPKSEEMSKARVDEGKSKEEKQAARYERNLTQPFHREKTNPPKILSQSGVNISRTKQGGESIVGDYVRAAKPTSPSSGKDSDSNYRQAKSIVRRKIEELKAMPKRRLGKAESKHDRCVESVEQSSPEVKNPHAVCVARGVTPRKWKK